MSEQKKQKRNVPDINKIHYGISASPSGNVKKAGTSTDKVKNTSSPARRSASAGKDNVRSTAAAQGTSRTAKPEKSGTAKQGTAIKTAAPASPVRRPPAKETPKSAPVKVQKTKKQIEEEKRLEEQKRRAMEREERIRQQIMAQEEQRRRERLRRTALTIINTCKNVAVGICIAIVAALIIGFIYYRNITYFHSDVAGNSYAFYGYIDPEADNQAANKNRELREKNKESAKVSFKKKHKVINGVAYLPISPLTEYFGFSMSGDDNVRTVNITGKNGEHTVVNSAIFKRGANDIVVNGSIHTMSNAPIFQNGDVYVPFEFFERFINGISFKEINKLRSTTVGIILEQPSITFIGSQDKTITAPNIKDYITTADAKYMYSFDISPYEQYINPADPHAYLTLINLENRLDEDYEPDDLVDILYTRPTKPKPERMRLDAAKALEAMLKAAETEGINDVTVTSGYREYAYQSQLFNTRLNQKIAAGIPRAQAEEETAKFTMYPGASEHQSGLCVDMHNLPSALQAFAEKPEFSWLYKHCADFGFILRYPQNKEEVTGISFEPWHYRFVGRYHAQRIMDSGLCLEEYIQQLSEEAAEQP